MLLVNMQGLTAGEEVVEKRFHIQECDSGVEHPAAGDESFDVAYEGMIYHMRVLHPKVMEVPFFSSPIFWVSREGGEFLYPSFTTAKTHVGVLTWHSISGYFFAEKEGKVRGFFLEDGFENWDNGSSGLIFVYDGEKSYAYRWAYNCDPEREKGAYTITSLGEKGKGLANIKERLAEVLNHAEKEAEAWAGP